MTPPLKRGKKVSDVQVEKLMEYMLQNRDFALGRFKSAQGKKKSQKKWEALAQNLNEYGPIKNVKQWKTVWKDMRLRARKSNAEAAAASKVTGNKKSVSELSELHKKILFVIDTEGSEVFGTDESDFDESMMTRRKKEEKVIINDSEDEERIGERSEVENNKDVEREMKKQITIANSISFPTIDTWDTRFSSQNNGPQQQNQEHTPSMNVKSRRGSHIHMRNEGTNQNQRQDSQQHNSTLPQDVAQHSKQRGSRRGEYNETEQQEKSPLRIETLHTNTEGANTVLEIARALNRVADGLFAIAEVLNRNSR